MFAWVFWEMVDLIVLHRCSEGWVPPISLWTDWGGGCSLPPQIRSLILKCACFKGCLCGDAFPAGVADCAASATFYLLQARMEEINWIPNSKERSSSSKELGSLSLFVLRLFLFLLWPCSLNSHHLTEEKFKIPLIQPKLLLIQMLWNHTPQRGNLMQIVAIAESVLTLFCKLDRKTHNLNGYTCTWHP